MAERDGLLLQVCRSIMLPLGLGAKRFAGKPLPQRNRRNGARSHAGSALGGLFSLRAGGAEAEIGPEQDRERAEQREDAEGRRQGRDRQVGQVAGVGTDQDVNEGKTDRPKRRAQTDRRHR